MYIKATRRHIERNAVLDHCPILPSDTNFGIYALTFLRYNKLITHRGQNEIHLKNHHEDITLFSLLEMYN